MAFRGAYLGTPGSMFMFAHVRGKVSSSTSRKTTYHETLGGNLRAQVSPAVLREWSCSIPMAEQHEITHLAGLVSGLYGVGPFAWVPVTATMTNVLSISGSMPGALHTSWTGDGVGVGVFDIPGLGRISHGVIPTGSIVTQTAPLAAGFPVTGAAYVNGGNVRLEVLDSTGVVIAQSQSSGKDGAVTRVHTTLLDTPPTAAGARLRIMNSAGAALPSISWTKDLKPWVPGGGSNYVMVQDFDSGIFHLDSNESLEDISFKVKELNSGA